MTASPPTKIELDPKAIDLGHQLQAFVETGHAYGKDIHQHTVNLVTYIATSY
jgi:hypothetical protein